MIGATEGVFGSILIVLSARSVAQVCRTSLCHKGRCTPRCISLLCFEASYGYCLMTGYITEHRVCSWSSICCHNVTKFFDRYFSVLAFGVPNFYSVAFHGPLLYQIPCFFVAHILFHCKAPFHNLSYFTSLILNQIIEARTLTWSFTLDKVFKHSYESPVFYWVPSWGSGKARVLSCCRRFLSYDNSADAVPPVGFMRENLSQRVRLICACLFCL